MVAHGETVGFQSQIVQAPEWAKETFDAGFLPPRSGA
jgi:hypothetical protein